MSKFTRQPLSVAIKAAGLAGSLSLAAVPAFAAFEEVTVDSPFDVFVSGTEETSLVLQDFDDDGDLDGLVFHDSQNDTLGFNDGCDTSFYENTGSKSSPQFTHVQDQTGYGYGGDNFDENPFLYGWGCSSYGHPVSAGDLDDDGVADFLGGTDASTLAPVSGFTEVDAYGLATGFTNTYFGDGSSSSTFYGAGIMSEAQSYGYAAGLLVDLDNDSDMDVIVTDYNQIRVFQNNGTDAYGVLQLDEQIGSNNPFYAGSGLNLQLSTNYYGAPLAAGDVDNDGDQDVIMGVRFGPDDMRLYINTGSAGTASFEEVTGADFTAATGVSFDASVDDFTAPVMADIDNDGDDDLVVVEQQAAASASYRLFLNDADPVDPALVAALLDDDDDDGFLGSTGIGALLLGGLSLLFRRRR